MDFFFGGGFDEYGYDYDENWVWRGRAEKSKHAEEREEFAIKQFDSVRRRIEHTKVQNNELIIRNGTSTNCNHEGEVTSLLQRLPEITLVHILQYARPPNFQTDREEFNQEGTGLKLKDPPVYAKERYKEREKKWQKSYGKEKLEATNADEKEMAIAAAGVGIVTDSAVAAAASSSSSSSSSSSLVAKKKRAKRSGDKISCNKSSEYDGKQENPNSRKRKALVAGLKTTGLDDGDIMTDDDMTDEKKDDNNDNIINGAVVVKKLRYVDEIINYLYEPGQKLDIVLLNPDTHMTGPCWRDFNRHVKSFPGWTAKRIEATPEESKHHGHFRKGKGYFLKILYTIPDPVKEEKKKKAAEKRELAATKKKLLAAMEEFKKAAMATFKKSAIANVASAAADITVATTAAATTAAATAATDTNGNEEEKAVGDNNDATKNAAATAAATNGNEEEKDVGDNNDVTKNADTAATDSNGNEEAKAVGDNNDVTKNEEKKNPPKKKAKIA